VTASSILDRAGLDLALPAPHKGGLAIDDITAKVADLPEFDGHRAVLHAHEAATGLEAFVAIHDTSLGPPLGGTRFRAYGSRSEAVADALRLSRAMSFKTALAGIPAGGGKAILVADPRTGKTQALLYAYGRLLERLGGLFAAGQDAGVDVADLDRIAEVTRHVYGTSLRGSGDPAPDTALGVLAGMRAGALHRFGSDSLSGLTVAVQGLGHVGIALCGLLADEGARLIVADVDAARISTAVSRFGAVSVAAPDIHRVHADIFAPCALGGVLDAAAIDALDSVIVAGAANNPLVRESLGEALRVRGILYAPDYVINAGGVIHVAAEVHGRSRGETVAAIRGIGATLGELFRRAASEGIATNALAERMARERIARAGGRGEG
jgi:leucine dehydrogenase